MTARVRLESIAFGGDAVGRLEEGLAVFVPGGAPGDLAEIELVERSRKFGRGRLIGLVEASPDRVSPPCRHYGECGGCQLQHLNYAAQLQAKQRMVEDALGRIGRLSGVPVRPILGAGEPWRYRGKATFVFAGAAEDARDLPRAAVRAGFFARESHRVVDVERCPIQGEIADRALAASRAIRLPGGAALSWLELRVNADGDQAVATLGTGARVSPEIARESGAALGMLREAVPELTGILLRDRYSRVPSEEGSPPEEARFAVPRTLWGEPYLRERMGGLTWRVHAASFFQVNPRQAETLLEVVLGLSRAGAGDRVVDAYSGAGFFAIPLALRGCEVHAIEASPLAAADAGWNARAAAGEGGPPLPLRVVRGAVERVLAGLSRRGVRLEELILDPPRTGAREAVPGIVALAPRRIVYVSCDPATLARDLAGLVASGYEVREVQPVDMFPQTYHVETVTLLEKSS